MHAVLVDIQKDPNAAPVRLVDQRLELSGRTQGRLDLIRFYIRVL